MTSAPTPSRFVAHRTGIIIARAFAIFAIAAVMVMAAANPGHAAPTSAAAIGLRVEPSSSVYPEGTAPQLHVRLTNLSAASCSLAATSELTVALLDGSRDGQPLVPSYVRSLPIDGAAATVATRSKSVAPHGELAFDLDTGGVDAFPTSVALPDDSMLTALYPLTQPGRYQLRLAYAMPPSAFVADSATTCAGTSDPVTVTFTVRTPGPAGGLPWYLIAIVALVLVALAVLALLLRRRSKRRRGSRTVAGAAALILLAVAGLVLVEGIDATPASAGIIYGADPQKSSQIYNTYLDCIGKIAAFDPGLITALNGVNVTVFPWTDSKSQPKQGSGKDSLIGWDPFGGTGFVGETSGATYDPCAGLYHELNHARDHAQGNESDQYCDDTGVLRDEVRATLAENRFRAAQKPPLPPRTTYDGKKIPTSMDGCTPPKKKADNGDTNPGVCRGIDGPCGTHTGDPHLLTFDGYRFDFQAVGEFVAVRSSAGDMEIQVRQSAYPDSRVVAVDTAVAMRVAGTRLGFYLDQGRISVHRDGAATAVPVGTTDLSGGAKINHVVDPSRGDGFAVVWPDGSAAWVVQVGRWGLTLAVQPRASRAGTLTGLLGPFDADKTNDVSTVDGKKLTHPPAFDELYHNFAQGWRVSDASSLFDYASGTATKDFTDLTFPDRPSTVDSLGPAKEEAARAACTLLGVVDPAQLADCMVDVGSTGQALFAVNSMHVQAATGSAGKDTGDGSGSVGATQTLTVGTGATVGSLSFDATAGQRAYVDVVDTTLPDGCGVPELMSPQASTLAIGCLHAGKGSIDGTVLPTTGRYQVVARPRGGVTGTITMRVILSQDFIGSITPDGPPVTFGVHVAGQIARLNFTAVAGEKVFLDVPASTVPSGCGRIGLAPSDGAALAIGCTSPTGVGLLDTTTIPRDGTYSVLLDPPADAVGTATVRLTVVQDEHQAIVLNGPPVLATVSEAGAQSLLTFYGTAGQKVIVDGTGATAQLAGCGTLALRNPSDIAIDIGCVKDSDGTGRMGPTTLPVTGTYTIAVDPQDRRIGSITLRLHT